MALVDTYTSAARIDKWGTPANYVYLSYQSGTGQISRRRTETESAYSLVGMTKAAADAGAAALKGVSTHAIARRTNDANMWQIDVATTAYGTWDTY